MTLIPENTPSINFRTPGQLTVKSNQSSQIDSASGVSIPTDTYEPNSFRSGTDMEILEYQRLAQEGGFNKSPSGPPRTNGPWSLPDDWRVDTQGPVTEYKNGVHDSPKARIRRRRSKRRVKKKVAPRIQQPNFGPLRPPGPLRTGVVKPGTASSREIPVSTPKDFYPPNHPAMRKELESNTTEAAVYAAKNSDFRENWLESKLSGEWKYENEDFHNFNKGACGAMLHLSVDYLVSDGYREGYGYGDTKISKRAERMIRRGYNHANKP